MTNTLKSLDDAVKGDIFLITVKDNGTDTDITTYPATFDLKSSKTERTSYHFLYGPAKTRTVYYEGEGHQRIISAVRLKKE